MTEPDVELLADLDAGLLDEDTAASVRTAAEADPAARAVLAALAATRADLAASPDPPVPGEMAARWSAALREAAQREAALREAAQREAAQREAAQPPVANPDAPTPDAPSPPPAPGAPDTSRATPVGPADRPRPRREARGRRGTAPHEGRPQRGRRPSFLRRPAVLAAAVLLVVLALAALFGRGRAEVAVDGTTLVRQVQQSRGLHDAGAFGDPARRASCLAAVQPAGVTPAAPLLGGRQVTFEGHDGVLLLLGTGRIGQVDVVVVDPSCAMLLASVRVGG